jgi:uncharacterized protein (DUF4415 family)
MYTYETTKLRKVHGEIEREIHMKTQKRECDYILKTEIKRFNDRISEIESEEAKLSISVVNDEILKERKKILDEMRVDSQRLDELIDIYRTKYEREDLPAKMDTKILYPVTTDTVRYDAYDSKYEDYERLGAFDLAGPKSNRNKTDKSEISPPVKKSTRFSSKDERDASRSKVTVKTEIKSEKPKTRVKIEIENDVVKDLRSDIRESVSSIASKRDDVTTEETTHRESTVDAKDELLDRLFADIDVLVERYKGELRRIRENEKRETNKAR